MRGIFACLTIPWGTEILTYSCLVDALEGKEENFGFMLHHQNIQNPLDAYQRKSVHLFLGQSSQARKETLPDHSLTERLDPVAVGPLGLDMKMDELLPKTIVYDRNGAHS